jgi:hypothetical protein
VSVTVPFGNILTGVADLGVADLNRERRVVLAEREIAVMNDVKSQEWGWRPI